MEERLKRAHCRLVVWIRADGEQEEDDPRHHSGNGNGSLAPNVLDVDGEPRNDGAWHANDTGDSVVSIDYICRRRRLILASIL